MTDPTSPPFNEAHDFVPMTLEDMATDLSEFKLNFNASSYECGFHKFFYYEHKADQLTLRVCDNTSEIDPTGKMLPDIELFIKESSDGAGYELVSDLKTGLEPGMYYFPKDPASIQLLLNQCKVTILAAVPPEQGLAYGRYMGGQAGPTDSDLRVIH